MLGASCEEKSVQHANQLGRGVDGVSFVDRIGWDAYNESVDLVEQIEAYSRRFGHYSASVHVDKIYSTRENHRYCHSKGIRPRGRLWATRGPSTKSTPSRSSKTSNNAVTMPPPGWRLKVNLGRASAGLG